ncbi:MAG: enoyl-CoA hydratase/isomerase family protein [Lawsonella sp.]|nr:enoyl-CoA hydratase/isomerase family protein [Mycobacteriales bacterium]
MSNTRSDATDFPHLLYWRFTQYRNIWIFQLDDPPFNSLRLRHWEELKGLLGQLQTALESSDTIAGLVIVGSKKMFSVGTEDSSIDGNSALRAALDHVRKDTYTLLSRCAAQIPVVAALSGYVKGDAWELATRCTYRVMGDNARLVPSSESSYMTAQEGHGAGLVDELVGPDYVLARAQEWVSEQSASNLGDV